MTDLDFEARCELLKKAKAGDRQGIILELLASVVQGLREEAKDTMQRISQFPAPND